MTSLLFFLYSLMLIGHYSKVPEEKPAVLGAEASLRWLISEKDGAKNFALRLFEIKKKGEKIPLHHHHFEHEIFIIRGKGKLKSKDKEWELKEGDFVFIEPKEEHSFENIGEEPFQFICVIPILR